MESARETKSAVPEVDASWGKVFVQNGAEPVPTLSPLQMSQRAAGNSFLQRAFSGEHTTECLGGCGGTCEHCARPRIQPKLVVGAAGDRYEQEADHVADQVMRKVMSPQPRLHATDGLVQREEADEPSTAPPAQAGSEDTLMSQIQMVLAQDGVQAKSIDGDLEFADGLEAALAGTKGGGQPMPQNVRNEMESAFGADFGGVRLHTDERAAQMSRALNAHAFAHGRDIYFNNGTFNPATAGGKRLLAHELTHTLQQDGNEIHRLEITKNQFTPGDCGGRVVKWDFTLGSPAAESGYMVQKVTQMQTVEACPSDVKSISLTPTSVYWEAWEVDANKTQWSFQSSVGYTDSSQRPPLPDKSGTQASVGKLKFFPRAVTGDLGGFATPSGDPGSSWGPGKGGTSGDLTSTSSEPAWWKNSPTEGPKNRWASSWWNCCSTASSNFSKIDADPK